MSNYDRLVKAGDYQKAARIAIANGQAAPTLAQQWEWADAAISAATAAGVPMHAGAGRWPDWTTMLKAVKGEK